MSNVICKVRGVNQRRNLFTKCDNNDFGNPKNKVDVLGGWILIKCVHGNEMRMRWDLFRDLFVCVIKGRTEILNCNAFISIRNTVFNFSSEFLTMTRELYFTCLWLPYYVILYLFIIFLCSYMFDHFLYRQVDQ